MGVLEKRILEEYGNVARWNGPLGVCFFSGGWEKLNAYADIVVQEDRLWIADPKAVHHVIQGSSHMYKKPSSERGRFALVMDRGLVWAEGEPPLTPAYLTPNLGIRRCTQATEKSHGSRVRTRRSQRVVPLLCPMFQFSESSFYPGLMLRLNV